MESARSCEPVVKYVGHKVSCLRWKPQPAGAIEGSDVFISGSYDDETNRVCVWHFDPDDHPATAADLLEPQLVCELEVNSEVTDLMFLDTQRVVASLSNGCVALFVYQAMLKKLSMVDISKCLHHLKGVQPVNPLPCTAMSVCGSGSVGLVTGGEDGRINVLGMDNLQPIRIIDLADNAVITSLACTMQLEVLSTSSSGQLKLWDLRSHSDTPTKTIVVSGEYVSLQSMDRHPHQPHLVALGRGDGSVCFMDLRQEKAPVPTIVQAHSSDVWGVKFHPTYPNNLFTCSHDGSLWHWDATSSAVSSTTTTTQQQLQQLPSSSSRPSSTTPLRTHTSFLTSKTNTNRLQTSHTTTATDSFISHSTPLSHHPRGAVISSKPSNFVSATSPVVHTHSQHLGEVSCLATDSSPWLSGAVQQGKVEVVNFTPNNTLSVNCFDIESRHLVCGTDSESIIVVPNLTLT